MYSEEEEQKNEQNSLFQTKRSHINTFTNSSYNNSKCSSTIITLQKHTEIAMLFRTGIWFREVSVSLVVGENIFSDCKTEKCRFLITTKGIKKKPERNQLKRRIREHIRILHPSIVVLPAQNKKGKFKDIALIASNPYISFTELGREIYTLFQCAMIISK